ncbi:MAG: ribosome recycling factor [Candidatus Synechococcus spongiarum 15L]|uniref:Ribosome-recycling factor n=4 Tax=Candidatus Synechococcus spongiarum TaxID=431041 RepID=A0A1T1D275_9SYNE|nr:MAG: ribosome recycling factor [Candidatus Synechococcus spongiarum 15L]OOV34924.1 ribosome-recycling factor [Candidatus Synechococcus spongiarum LMB bulk15M]OOV35915.1 ribosome-recycling factor [Candidatus Synechococcus spongiarum LMB bulk15N]
MNAMDLEANMEKSLEATQRNLNTIRTGRANPNLLDKVMVEYYGCDTPLRSLAGITAPDSQTLQLQPFDISAIRAIEKAILSSGLGLTPNEDGKLIRIGIPPLTEERRKELVKLAAGYVEEGKVALRNLRREGIDRIKKQEKAGDLSEDQSHDAQDDVQKLTDRFIQRLNTMQKDKEKDILSV